MNNRICIEVKAHGVEVGALEAAYVRSQLGRALKPFQSHVRHVTVRLTDLNGPRGGDSDMECRVVVEGAFPSVVLSERAVGVTVAIDVAADRVSHAVARAIGRSRTHLRRMGMLHV